MIIPCLISLLPGWHRDRVKRKIIFNEIKSHNCYLYSNSKPVIFFKYKIFISIILFYYNPTKPKVLHYYSKIKKNKKFSLTYIIVINMTIKDSCEIPQCVEKDRIKVRPILSFVSDATYHDSVKDKAKSIEVMCRCNTAN